MIVAHFIKSLVHHIFWRRVGFVWDVLAKAVLSRGMGWGFILGAVTRPLRTVNLAPPFDGVLLWLRLDHDDAWRFHAWESGRETSIPPEAPPTTLSTGFRTPRDAAQFYTQVLQNPDAAGSRTHASEPRLRLLLASKPRRCSGSL